MTIKWNNAEFKRILTEVMRGPVSAAARQIAANVDVGSVTDAEVTVREYTTDRAACAVSIAHPAGAAIEAKHGSLTKAASAAGFTVNSKGAKT